MLHCVQLRLLRRKNCVLLRAFSRLERTSRRDGDITEWLCRYLECLCRAVETSEETLSGVLRKAVFWHTYADVNVSERQSLVLNKYLDGYDAKLTATNWAKIAGISTDTASGTSMTWWTRGCLRRQREDSVTFHTTSTMSVKQELPHG